MGEKRRRLTKLPSVRRLPSYLRIIRARREAGHEYISTTHLAEALDLQPIIVRKDLSVTGVVGKPRVGYPADKLIQAIEGFLGWQRPTESLLIGVGHLGTALLGYRNFDEYRLSIVAAFDTDSHKLGTVVHGRRVQALERLPFFVRERGVKMAILTVPAAAAQEVTDLMILSGIRGIWNFTPVKLTVPATVVVHKEDLAAGLGVLSLKLRKLMEEEEALED